MKVKCEYCGVTFEDTLERCPSCGASNPSKKSVEDEPRTIEELKKWYKDRNLPSEEVTRFFIGKDYRDPRAFGIYKNDSGEFVVYKNKASGDRAIRYQGKDEEYAVHELWQKLKDEIVRQKAGNRPAREPVLYIGRVGLYKESIKAIVHFFITIFVICILVAVVKMTISSVIGRHDGYYNFNNELYYKSGSSWYTYDAGNDYWQRSREPYLYDDGNTDPYFISKDYDDATWEYDSYEFSDIKDDATYQTDHSSSHDGYNWDSGSSWDSGGSDWDSDW